MPPPRERVRAPGPSVGAAGAGAGAEVPGSAGAGAEAPGQGYWVLEHPCDRVAYGTAITVVMRRGVCQRLVVSGILCGWLTRGIE